LATPDDGQAGVRVQVRAQAGRAGRIEVDVAVDDQQVPRLGGGQTAVMGGSSRRENRAGLVRLNRRLPS
jgi:hypothetical protein